MLHKPKLAILLLSLIICCLAGWVQAGVASNGRVVHVTSVGDVILFSVGGGAQAARPSCATTGRFAVHKDSSHAPVVLTAFARGSILGSVYGTGACTLHSTSEDVQMFEVCPQTGC